MADIPGAGALRSTHGWSIDVVRNPDGAAPLLCNGRELRRTLQTLSRGGLVVFLCRAGFPREDQGIQVRARGQVLHGLGEPSVLLGLSGMHGGRHSASHRLSL